MLSIEDVQKLMDTVLKIKYEETDDFSYNEYKLASQMKKCLCITLDSFVECDTDLLDRFIEADIHKIAVFFRYLWATGDIDNYKEYVYGSYMTGFATPTFIINLKDAKVTSLEELATTENEKERFKNAFSKQCKAYKDYAACVYW